VKCVHVHKPAAPANQGRIARITQTESLIAMLVKCIIAYSKVTGRDGSGTSTQRSGLQKRRWER
jgi:hypothetical protein